MTNAASFREPGNWLGGFYELAIEVGPTGDDDRLAAALAAVWTAAGVEGCVTGRDAEPEEQPEAPCTLASLAGTGHLQGRVRLPEGQLVVCGCMVVREEDGSDWLDFYVPTGALDAAGVPARAGLMSYRSAALDDWLAAVATEAHRTVSFPLALVGWEVSGSTDAATLAGRPPAHRTVGYLLPQGGSLHYAQANA
ncbi:MULTISPECIES: hypothetical protein [unclassified Kitasatospora]|uniref:hypothetical protein n=1 Tax=unclassified Kitasatospora TaxID=2633591 RepID=UPI0035E1E022